MKSSKLTVALMTIVCSLLLAPEAKAQGSGQGLYGFTSIDYDPSTNLVTAYSETNADLDIASDYDAHVILQVLDQYGVPIATKAATNPGTYVSVQIEFDASPGATYTAVGIHQAYASLYTFDDRGRQWWYDNFWFGYFEGQGVNNPLYYYFLSPGYAERTRRTRPINLGRTYDSVSITPKIDSITPARGLVGNTIAVSIDGHGFGINPTISAGSGITVTVNFANSSSFHIDASFAISANANGGNHAVSVTVGGQTSNSMYFFVQIPSRLIRYNSPQLPGGISDLHVVNGGPFRYLDGSVFPSHENVCGAYRNLLYQVADQEGQPIVAQGIEITESFPAGEFTGAQGTEGLRPPDKTETTDGN